MISTWLTAAMLTAVLNLSLEYLVLTKRKSLATHIVVRLAHLAAVFAATFLYLRHIDPDSLLGGILRYCISSSFILPCLFLFAESISQKVFLFFMDWGFTTFFTSLCVWVAARAGNALLAYSVIFLPVFGLALPLYSKYLKRGVRRILFLFEFGSPSYVAMPILTFVLFSALFGPLSPPTRDWSSFFLMLLFEVQVVFSYYVLFAHFFVVYDRMRTMDDFRSAERQLHLQKQYYEEVDKGIRRQRELIHDARHHLTTISALAKAGDAEAVGPYVDRLLAHYVSRTMRRYCENSAANAIIGSYIEVAEGEGIPVSTDIDLPLEIGIDEYALCALFGNAIENAIEACRRIPDGSELRGRRFISIKSRTERGRLVVRIENSFNSARRVQEGAFPSEKGSFGGIGLESIRAVVEKYDGCLNCERLGEMFALSAILYCRSA